MAATLSDLLLSVRLDNAVCALLSLADCSNIRVPRSHWMIAHLVLDGSANFVNERGEETLARQYDLIIVSNGSKHYWKGRFPGSVHKIDRAPTMKREDEPVFIQPNPDKPDAALILSTAFGLDRPERNQVNSILPYDTMHLSGGHLKLPGLDSAVSLPELCRGPGSSAFCLMLIDMLFTQAMRFAFQRALTSQGETYPPVPTMDIALLQMPPIAAILRLLDRHLDWQWTVAQMAITVGMSRSAFAEAFTHTVGTAPIRYLTEQRMREAHRLLERAGELSIGSIANRVGYQSQAAFSRAFHQHFGYTPRRARGNAGPAQ